MPRTSLREAEAIYQFDDQYWLLDGDMQPAWGEEIELLIKAVETSADSDSIEYGRQFLAQRDRRRQEFGLTADLIAYEVSIEWLEGTAKYVELRSWQQAGRDPGYLPLLEMETDPDFKGYEDFDGQWSQAMRQTYTGSRPEKASGMCVSTIPECCRLSYSTA